MIGFDHSVTIRRYEESIDSEGRPIGIANVVTNAVAGYAHEYSATESSEGATSGDSVRGFLQLPYGTDVKVQDLADVTFRDGSTKQFRVIGVRDNHRALRCEIARQDV